MPGITTPTLVCGAHDTHPGLFDARAPGITAFGDHRLSNSSHMPMWEEPLEYEIA
jgi:hypothetical protein